METVGVLCFAYWFNGELRDFGEPGRAFLGGGGAQVSLEHARIVEAEQCDCAVGQFRLEEAAEVPLELLDQGVGPGHDVPVGGAAVVVPQG